MNILLALDSFKGSCSSEAAGAAVAEGIRQVLPGANIHIHGIADGGEGSAQVLLNQTKGNWIAHETMGPLPSMKAASGFVDLPEEQAVVVEMATSAGLHLMAGKPLEPLRATTFGVGECVNAAFAHSPASELMLCLGGSSTTDGGVGMAKALGWRFLDAAGREVGLGGGELANIQTIQPPPKQGHPTVKILCDVHNPLLGSTGSATVYGPQKGANADQVKLLEEGLSTVHRILLRDLGVDVNQPGDGAAGGLAAGARAFLGGELVSGIETIMDLTGIDRALDEVDWVITGEGRLDAQSLSGKVVDGILGRARPSGVNVGVIAGQISLSGDQVSTAGISWSKALMLPGERIEASMAQTEARLIQAGREFGRRSASPRPPTGGGSSGSRER